jgi:hypothetical protein
MNLELDVSNLRTTNAALAAALHVAESTARTATKEATYLAHRVSKLEARAANEKASKYVSQKTKKLQKLLTKNEDCRYFYIGSDSLLSRYDHS